MAEKTQQRPPLSSSPCSPSLPNIFQRYGHFLVGCWVISSSRSQRNSSPHHPLYIHFFRHSFCLLKRRVNVLPHAFHPSTSPLQLPSHHRHHRSVDCCVDPTISSHLRPALCPSLIFLKSVMLAPQTRGPNAARTSPTTRRLQ